MTLLIFLVVYLPTKGLGNYITSAFQKVGIEPQMNYMKRLEGRRVLNKIILLAVYK